MIFSSLRLLSAPIASLVLITLGNAFFITITSLWLQEYGYSVGVIAIVGSSYNLGQLVGLKMERLMHRIGHIRLFMTCSSLIACCIAVQSIFTSSWSWCILRLITGGCVAGVFVVIESWLLLFSKPDNRGKILSLYMFFLSLSRTISQWIRQLVDIKSPMPFLIASVLCSLSAIPLGITESAAPRLSRKKGVRIGLLIKKSPLGCMTCLVAGLILGAGYTFFPLFAQSVEKQFPSLTMPLIQFFIIAGGFILQYPIGYLSDLFDRRLILTYLSVITTAIASLLIFSFVFHPIVIAILCIAIGGLIFTLYPLGMTQVSDSIDESDFPKAVSLLIIIYGIGAVLGPLLSQCFIRLSKGYVGIFIHIAFCAFVLTGMCFWHMRRFCKVPDDEQGNFVPMPSIAPLIPDIDPRTEKQE